MKSIILAFLFLTSTLHALELGPPFRDHAILQREMKLPVWGWSKPKTSVTVTFAGQSKQAEAGPDGKWTVELKPLKASFDPTELVISEKGGDTITLKDILVGEVWLASGQSNMQWVASKCDTGRVLQKQIAERVAAGEEKAPVIREAKITNYFAALHPIEHADAEWSSDQGNFSAIAFSFAYDLQRELKVPIGILNCSFSQTSIQAWTPRVGFANGTSDCTKALYQKILESDPSTPEHKKAWRAFYQQQSSHHRRQTGTTGLDKDSGEFFRQPRFVLALQCPPESHDSLRHSRSHLEPGIRQQRRRTPLLRQPPQHDPGMAHPLEQ
ncbi:MAG: sialate O-acetylesterase, partial [Akkermansiaceae bacterium]